MPKARFENKAKRKKKKIAKESLVLIAMAWSVRNKKNSLNFFEMMHCVCLFIYINIKRRKREESREREEEQQEQHEEQDENPYIFEEDKDFETRVETEGGRIRVLKKFTEKSKLLQGIENFRLAILEARAHTFVSPRHFDSEVVFFNIKGT